MDINEMIILIISSSLKIEKMLGEIIDDDKITRIITVDNLKTLSEGEVINPSIIILDEEDIDIQRKNIECIKIDSYLSRAEVLLVLKEQNKEFIAEFVKKGIREYITTPYSFDEFYIRVRSVYQYVYTRSQCKHKDIQLKALMNNIPYMTWVKDIDSNYITVNDKFEKYSGKFEKIINGRDDDFVWDGKLGGKCKEHDAKVMTEQKQFVFEEVIPGIDFERQFCVYKAPVIDEYDNIRGIIGIARDITELKNKEAELDIIIENIPFGVCLKDNYGKILNVNSEFLGYYEVKKEDIIGNDGYGILNNECYEILKNEDFEIINNKSSRVFERQIKINGEYRIMEVHKEPIFDIFNKIIGIVALIRDVTDIKNNEANIKRLAYSDDLTGLDNRRSLYEYISNDLKKKDVYLTIMFIDLDNFKSLNDNLGHYYGDEVLVEISRRIKSVCEGAFIARIGGDEFVIILEGITDKEILNSKIKEVLKVINTEFIHGDKNNLISGSIGVVSGNTNQENVENLLTKGDLALYKAKEKGKNQFVIYTEDLEAERKFNIEIERDLRNCIRNDEVMVYYQPQYGKNRITGEGVLIGFEALFRWNNRNYKHMPVIDIIRTIEKCNIMDIIDEFIIIESFKFAKRINEGRKHKLVVSINISALQIMDDDFFEHFKSLLDKVGVSPEVIGIEITETVLLENIDENIHKITALKALGIKVSLDDFGTGYSSLNYLVKLPLSHVKIDKSFIRNMSSREEYIKLVGLIIEVAHSLGLEVVAEGVETYDELVILDGMGIDFIQGYFFSKPICEEDAEKLAQRKR